MEVLSITLKNFKAHRDRFYEFCPGTNAICGENGAGKTSIFEAIAWVLFDHCDYTKTEIISAGAKSAQVTVTFSSTEDSRVYEVRRCTSQGYSLHDPQLNANLGLKKIEDVKQWLCEHLGVPPTTELNKLFAETIGIPQGTFTVDFLKRPADRKKVFDPILKVEEYKQAYSKSRDLEAYAQGQVRDLERAIATYDQQLIDWPDLKAQAAKLRKDIRADQAQMTLLVQQLEQQKSEVERLAAIDQALQALGTQVQQCQAQTHHKQESLELLEVSWVSAQKAVTLCRQHRPSFQAYEQALESLHTFAAQRQQQQQLLKQRDQIQQKLSKQQIDQSQLQGQLASFDQMRLDLEQWRKHIPRQEQLEQSQADGRQQLQQLENAKLQIQMLQPQIQQRQAHQEQLAQEIARLHQLEPQVQQLPILEAQQQDLRAHISRVEAAKQFAEELRQLVGQFEPDCDRHRQQVNDALTLLKKGADLGPVSEALEAGVALTSRMVEQLTQTLTDLSDPKAVQKSQTQLEQIQRDIQAAQQAQAQWSSLTAKQQQLQESKKETAELQQQSAERRTQLEQESVVMTALAKVESQLTDLKNPKGQVQVLQQQLQQEAPLQAKVKQLEHNGQELQHRFADVEQKLEGFADLEAQTEAQQQIQQENHEVHQVYLRHRNEANTFKTLDQSKGDAIATLKTLQDQLTTLQEQYQNQSQGHDPQQLAQATATYQQTKSQQDQLQGGLPPKQAQLQSLEQQLQIRQAVFEQRQQARKDQGPKQEVLQLVREARRIYNQSGPRITKLYLTEISWEADNLFRELLNRPDVALRWTEDYDIQVQAQGHWRSFRSLSGGEQMCAALAVRLALLKVLSDINVAFFDEPTTNMDQIRRQQLAEALGHLKTFRQLFVISHDDTFESVTENIIRVQRDAAPA
ncbi:putative DNA double-strand break repair Rad50 ATPase [Acaryochloris thomasi RCC1774]|uniref:Nuclease SbcCD subunit C n=1 Tax=Acaryochloris thomasi RCC1774 TaxID=1764569 RepID=A0A2W1JH77_9CYAN|nr:SMC family ATPase [Acaryochloris thomasi]PZD72919.1 putative DNA double-strand break repair Rad50 ATPase [Acaryochloris thomasi RCC1774]